MPPSPPSELEEPQGSPKPPAPAVYVDPLVRFNDIFNEISKHTWAKNSTPAPSHLNIEAATVESDSGPHHHVLEGNDLFEEVEAANSDSDSDSSASDCEPGEVTRASADRRDTDKEGQDDGGCDDGIKDYEMDDADTPNVKPAKGNVHTPAPLIPAARDAHKDLTAILRPPRASGKGSKPFEGDELLRKRLQMMKMFLSVYINEAHPTTWICASKTAAHAFEMSIHTAQCSRKWTRSFIDNCADLPFNLYGIWNTCMLQKGDLATEIGEHLQSIGKYVKAKDMVIFLDADHIKMKYAPKKDYLTCHRTTMDVHHGLSLGKGPIWSVC